MAINLPVPQDLKYNLYTLLQEILRRALDVSINPAQIPVSLHFQNAGSGIIWADGTVTNTNNNTQYIYSRDGTKVYRLIVDSDGVLDFDYVGLAGVVTPYYVFSRDGLSRYIAVVETDGTLSIDPA